MSAKAFDPLTEPIPGICPDFVGLETPACATSPEALFTNNSVLLLAFGLLAGLFSGFSLGLSASTTLVSGR